MIKNLIKTIKLILVLIKSSTVILTKIEQLLEDIKNEKQ